MIRWLLKNIGLTLAGLCFLMGCITVEARIEKIEAKLDQALKVESSLKQVAVALPRSALQ